MSQTNKEHSGIPIFMANSDSEVNDITGTDPRTNNSRNSRKNEDGQAETQLDYTLTTDTQQKNIEEIEIMLHKLRKELDSFDFQIGTEKEFQEEIVSSLHTVHAEAWKKLASLRQKKPDKFQIPINGIRPSRYPAERALVVPHLNTYINMLELDDVDEEGEKKIELPDVTDVMAIIKKILPNSSRKGMVYDLALELIQEATHLMKQKRASEFSIWTKSVVMSYPPTDDPAVLELKGNADTETGNKALKEKKKRVMDLFVDDGENRSWSSESGEEVIPEDEFIESDDNGGKSWESHRRSVGSPTEQVEVKEINDSSQESTSSISTNYTDCSSSGADCSSDTSSNHSEILMMDLD